jgi:ribosomal protein L7/L12
MKLKVTTEEAIILVKRALNLPSDTEVVITRFKPNQLKEVRALIAEIESLDYSASDKIRAIKRFREVVGGGLAEAKWSIENWSKVKEFMLKKRRWPLFDGRYPYTDLN